MSNSHYKSYKHEELGMAFGKKPINWILGDLGEARSMYTQTNTLTGKSCTTAVHRGNLAFMVPELIIEELSIASAGIDELKTVNLQKYAKKHKMCKTNKIPGFCTLTETTFIDNSRPEQKQKSRNTFCRHC